MSPKSPSPPLSALAHPTSDDTTIPGVEDLVRQRNTHLIELYCVSRLHELFNVKDRALLLEKVNGFLNANDIKSGKKFQVSTLPDFSQPSPPFISNNYINNNHNHHHTNNNSSTSIHLLSGDLASESKDISFKEQKASSSKRQDNDNDELRRDESCDEEKSNKKRPIETDEEEKYLNKKSKTDDHLSDNTKDILSGRVNEHEKPRSMYSMNTEPHLKPSPPPHMIDYLDISWIKAEPTPVENINKYKNPILKEVTQETLETVDYFNDHNINSKDSVYLLMKDNIPSKVAQALPLAELKYLAHTLPLVKLLPMAHKALTTDIINNALNEGRITVVSSRIEELRRLGLWSLRQPKRFIDPWEKEQSHIRVLLKEAKWMQADFKEGQKYKIAVCTTIAQSVLDYWNYGKICCTKRQPIKFLPNDDIIEHAESNVEVTEITNLEMEDDSYSTDVDNIICKLPHEDNEIILEHDSDLVVDRQGLSKDSIEINDESNILDHNDDIAMTTENITNKTNNLSIADSDVNVDMDSGLAYSKDDVLSKVTENQTVNTNIPSSSNTDLFLVKNHNLIEVSETDKLFFEEYTKQTEDKKAYPFKVTITFDELNSAEQSIMKDVPLYSGASLNEGSLEESLPFVPISKSIVTLDTDQFLKLVERQIVDEEQSLVQLSKRRGMFYGNRRSHYLKPPPAPSLKYLTNRTPTIWLPEDDEELVKNINAYAYNWELIAAHMLRRPRASYFSNIERRTPWQCFERFVQLNERFNFNDLKGPRAYNAQQWLMEAHKFQQKQNRRISPLGVGLESIQRGHRRLRWASMLEAVRKCIKKRENAPRPNPTQPRKPLDCKNMKVPTPAEMSSLKAQRDEALRRDIQMRRNAKNRLQQQQRQQQANAKPSSQGSAINSAINSSIRTEGTNKNNLNASSPPNSNSSLSASSNVVSQTPTQRVTQRQFTDREIIESYSRKILQQKPDLSPQTALKAAQNYYKSLKAQQLKQQQQKLQNNIAVASSSSNSSPSIQQINSPTPQEILQRLQKK